MAGTLFDTFHPNGPEYIPDGIFSFIAMFRLKTFCYVKKFYFNSTYFIYLVSFSFLSTPIDNLMVHHNGMGGTQRWVGGENENIQSH